MLDLTPCIDFTLKAIPSLQNVGVLSVSCMLPEILHLDPKTSPGNRNQKLVGYQQRENTELLFLDF